MAKKETKKCSLCWKENENKSKKCQFCWEPFMDKYEIIDNIGPFIWEEYKYWHRRKIGKVKLRRKNSNKKSSLRRD